MSNKFNYNLENIIVQHGFFNNLLITSSENVLIALLILRDPSAGDYTTDHTFLLQRVEDNVGSQEQNEREIKLLN